MDAIISPYHLTTREAPAMAGLLLAERAVTFMPAMPDAASEHELRVYCSQYPVWRELLESWDWSMPLWRAGVLGSGIAGDSLDVEVRAAAEQLAGDERYSGLAPLARPGLFDDHAFGPDAIAHDVLRGGPDPGVSLPIAAGLDRAAARHGHVVFRAGAASLAQRAEERLARRVCSVVVPTFTQAQGEHILRAREHLAGELDDLRFEFARSLDAATPDSARGVERAGEALTRAFQAAQGELTEADFDEPRVATGLASLTGVVLPTHAVLTSSAAAASALRRNPGTGQTRARVVDLDAPEVFCAVLVRVIGKR